MILPKVTTIYNNAFGNCSSLAKVDLTLITEIKASTFVGCSSLTTLILRNNSMVTLSNTNAFTNSAIANGTGYIYVPDALVDTYKADSAWSTYATQIKGISELPA